MTIITGLEGVLCRHEWRQDLIETEGWEAYHKAAERDAPNGPVIQAINAMHATGQHVFCVTTRPDKWRMLTLSWLVRHGVMVDTLITRPEGDWSTEDKLREAALETITSTSGAIMLVIDENEKACNFWRAANLPVLQLTNPNGGQ